MVISSMPAAMTFFISSAGHGEPAMMPVRTVSTGRTLEARDELPIRR
jgi:hypothetical protein